MAFPLQVVPPLIGAFVGAPVLAREFETGTFRFAWTQGFGRWRWTLAKLVGLGVVVAAASGALSVLVSWYYQPYFASGNQSPSLAKFNPLNPGLFDLRGRCVSPRGLWRPSPSAPWLACSFAGSSPPSSPLWLFTQGSPLLPGGGYECVT